MYSDNTAGHSGTDTSQERAEAERDNGTLSKRKSDTLAIVARAEGRGVTWREVSRYLGVHHGSASSVLTVLHQEGRIARTDRRRNRSKVYLTPDNALPSDTLEPYVPRGKKADDEIAALKATIESAFMALMAGNTAEALNILAEEP